MGPLAVFGITNDGLNLAVNLLLLFLVVLWLALVYWTYADARRRTEDPMLVGCATAASLFPFVGTIVYTIVRPPEYLEDAHERALEIAAAEARLASIQQLTCPYCSNEIEATFLRCPSCMNRLKEPCATCGKPLDPRWQICPYCEAAVATPAPQPARRERRAQPRPAEPARSQVRDLPTRETPATPGGGAGAAEPKRAAEGQRAATAEGQRAAKAEGQRAPKAAAQTGAAKASGQSRAQSANRQAPAKPEATRSARPEGSGSAKPRPQASKDEAQRDRQASQRERPAGQRERQANQRERQSTPRERPTGPRARP